MTALACVACVVTLIGCQWHSVEGAGAGAGRVELGHGGASMGVRRGRLAGGGLGGEGGGAQRVVGGKQDVTISCADYCTIMI